MPLKLSLGPRERVIIGTALIQNCGGKCELLIENQVPVLRGKHVLSEGAASSPCRGVYFAIQLLYLEATPNLELLNQALSLIRSVAAAAPSLIPRLSKICDDLVAEQTYSALLSAQELIQAEDEILASSDPKKRRGPEGPR